MSAPRTGSEDYYDRRAPEYDLIYDRPERQEELRVLERRFADAFAGRDVLEIAAGTGYWTQFFAETARSVAATDVNRSVLDRAQARRAWPKTVDFRIANVFELDAVTGEFDAAFAGFLWSHIRLAQLDRLLRHLAGRLQPRSLVQFVDNRPVPDSSTPVTRTDEHGNSYQTRTLADGSTWEVLKNHPTAEELTHRLSPIFTDVTITEFRFFWVAEAHTRA